MGLEALRGRISKLEKNFNIHDPVEEAKKIVGFYRSVGLIVGEEHAERCIKEYAAVGESAHSYFDRLFKSIASQPWKLEPLPKGLFRPS